MEKPKSIFTTGLLSIILALVLAACDGGHRAKNIRSGGIHDNLYSIHPGPEEITTENHKGLLSDSMADKTSGENYSTIIENKFLATEFQPLSTFGIDVDGASYSNVRRFINEGTMPPADAIRIEEMINYFPYEFPQPTGEHPFSLLTEMSSCPWNTKHRLISVGLKGKEIPTESLPPANIVFLVDVSGSMSAENKLPLVKTSLTMLTEKLRPADRVAIVVYAGAAGLVLPSTKGDQKLTIIRALEKLQSGGSTAGAEGIELAYKVAKENFILNGNNRVILATDGDFNVGLSSEKGLEGLIEEKRDEGIFLTVLGYGMGNYQDSKMQTLADKGNGNHAYIDSEEEAQKVLVNEFGGTLFTIAKDVKIQVEFNPEKVKAYRLVGYENRMLRAEDFDNDKKDAGELGSGHCVTALYEIIPAGSDETIPGDPNLKYQKTSTSLSAAAMESGELMNVKFRYKAPDEEVSKLITTSLMDSNKQLANTGNDFRFAAAVAEFSLLMRNSEYKGEADFDHVTALASSALGQDKGGYRAEFLKIVKKAEPLYRSAQTAMKTK